MTQTLEQTSGSHRQTVNHSHEQTPAGFQQLTEHIRDWCTADVHVDAEQRLVRNVALTGLQSRNGYRYTEQALREAVPHYADKPVFLDHAAHVSRPWNRSTRDLVGSIVNPRFEEGRIRADIQALGTEAGRTFLELAASDSPAVGMSHVVLARRSRDKSVVESIHDVVSVDAVVFPATAATFRENTHDPAACTLPGSLEAVLSEIDTRLPDHVRGLAETPGASVWRIGLYPERVLVETRDPEAGELRHYAVDWRIENGEVVLGTELTDIPTQQLENGTWTGDASKTLSTVFPEARQMQSLREELQQTADERDELRERVEALQRREDERDLERQIDRLLEESELPSFAVTETFREQLRQAPGAEDRQRLITERTALTKRSRRGHPSSRERADVDTDGLDDEAIVSALQKQRGSILAGFTH